MDKARLQSDRLQNALDFSDSERAASSGYKEEPRAEREAATRPLSDSQSIPETLPEFGQDRLSVDTDPLAEPEIHSKPESPKKPSPEGPVLRRSARARKPVDRTITAEEPKKPGKNPKKPRLSAMEKHAQNQNWLTARIYQDARSPLATTNLRALLTQNISETWDVLSPTDQAEIMAIFPNKNLIANGRTASAVPKFQELNNSGGFRKACAAYTRHVYEGEHESSWIQTAEKAHLDRQRGAYDDWMKTYFRRNSGRLLDESLEPDRRQRSAETGTSKTQQGP